MHPLFGLVATIQPAFLPLQWLGTNLYCLTLHRSGASMIKKKICLMGAFSVGKTSLVSRFVYSVFSNRYLTTVGVKVDKKELRVSGQDVRLMIWDLAGEDDVQETRVSYARGASGIFYVVDSTRQETLAVAKRLKERVDESAGDLPFFLLINKTDLVDEQAISDDAITEMESAGWRTIRTSAKTGDGVESAFVELARDMVSQ